MLRPSRLNLNLLALIAATGSVASAEVTPEWTVKKCALYKAASAKAFAAFGEAGIGQDFVQRHDAFLATGCIARADVCPRSPGELRLADMLTMMAVSEGTAGSFLPFACRD